MNFWRTLKVASVLLLSAGMAAAQTPTTPSQTPPDQPAATEPSSPTSAPPAERRSLTEEVVVTGSRIRRKDLTTPAPVTVVTREQFESSGRATIGDYLQLMPEQGNAPNFQLNTGGINYGADGATRIALRSLGVQRTLVLINGRRVVPAGLGATAAVDLNTIPTEAVERVEVLKDGASAVYGSDAIAGVVNIITRQRYNGTDLGAQYGSSQKGDAQTFDAHVTTGSSGDVGAALFSVRYFNQSDSWLRDRDWSKQALDFDYTGGGPGFSGSSRVPQGALVIPEDPNNLGNPLCGTAFCNQMVSTLGWQLGQRYIRNSGPTSGSPGTQVFCGANPLGQQDCFRKFNTPAADNNLSGNDFYNFAAQNYLTIPSTTIQGYSTGEARLSAARGYYELSYTQRSSTQNAAPMPLNPGDYANIVYSKNSVYNPFGTDLSFLGRRLVEFGNRTYAEDLSTFRVVTGIDGTLPEVAGPLHGWFWNAAFNYGRTSGTFTTGGAFRNSRVQSSTGPSAVLTPGGAPVCVADPNNPTTTVIAGCTPLNLLGGPGSIGSTQQSFLAFTGTSRAYDQLTTVGADVSGDLFPLAAERPLSLALGYEYRHQLGSQIADPVAAAGDSADFNFQSTVGGFYSNEAYAELLIPILANMPGIESLEASAAGRYVNYNTFGDKFTYKLGARYTPVRDLTVRGTFSTAFRAPSISELFLGNHETAPAATDPCANLNTVPGGITGPIGQRCTATGVTGSGSADNGLQELTRTGGTPSLKPERAAAFTTGLVFQPQAVRNLSFTLDYFHIDIYDAIGLTGTANILNGCYFGGISEYCALVVRNNSGLIQAVNDFYANIGQISTSGVDFAVRYALPTDYGRFAFGFDGSYLATYDITLNLKSGPVTVSGKDKYDAGSFGALPRLKATTGLDWSLGGFIAGITGRYVSSFDECSNPFDPTTAQGGICDIVSVDPNTQRTTVGPNPDRRRVHSFYTLDLHAGYTLTSTFGKTSFYAGILNFTDNTPPFIYSAALANSDPSTYDYVGRYIYGRVQHRF